MSRPCITGVQLEVRENNLSLVATDRYRVAVREIEWDGGGVASERVGHRARPGPHPAGGRQDLRPLAAPSRSRSRAGTTASSSRSAPSKKTVTSLLIKGNFPPVRRLFPETDRQPRGHEHRRPHRGRPAASRSCSSARPRCATRFTADGLTLEAIGSEQAQASETIDAILTGDDTVVSLKPQFLLDGLGAVHSRVRAHLVHEDREPQQAGPRAHHQPDLARAGRRRHVPLPAAAQPPAALSPSAPSRADPSREAVGGAG